MKFYEIFFHRLDLDLPNVIYFHYFTCVLAVAQRSFTPSLSLTLSVSLLCSQVRIFANLTCTAIFQCLAQKLQTHKIQLPLILIQETDLTHRHRSSAIKLYFMVVYALLKKSVDEKRIRLCNEEESILWIALMISAQKLAHHIDKFTVWRCATKLQTLR